MRVLIVLFALLVSACGKKEEPLRAPAPAVDKADAPVDCMDVTVIEVDRTGEAARSLFEYQRDGKTYRVARHGFFGGVGEKFSYCNYFSQPK